MEIKRARSEERMLGRRTCDNQRLGERSDRLSGCVPVSVRQFLKLA
ncbi:MAG: hypothetical protein OXG81_17215 [Acidobacteria bacterium]|nr:hypothetical protein [Acidobacteriota bacterium]